MHMLLCFYACSEVRKRVEEAEYASGSRQREKNAEDRQTDSDSFEYRPDAQGDSLFFREGKISRFPGVVTDFYHVSMCTGNALLVVIAKFRGG